MVPHLLSRLKGALSRRTAGKRSHKNEKYFSDVFVHERMLHDAERVSTYARAIARIVTPGMTVLDVGTGTGILAFLASRSGARTVHAVDHSGIIELARLVAESNGIENVSFQRSHSSAIAGIEVDAVIHELMGSFVDEEDMVATILDLRERVLRPGGKVLPNLISVFAEPVALKPGMRVPFLYEQSIGGIDYAATADALGGIGKAHVQLRPSDIECILSDPKPIYVFDLEKDRIEDIPATVVYEREIVTDGWLDGICYYFEARFGADGECVSNTPGRLRPDTGNWHCPLMRCTRRRMQPGDRLTAELAINDYRKYKRWSWSELRGGAPE